MQAFVQFFFAITYYGAELRFNIIAKIVHFILNCNKLKTFFIFIVNNAG